MFTQTHLLVGAAVFARPGNRTVALAGLIGALVPDTDVWAMFVIERLRGASGCEVFHYRYWEQPWTTLQILLNSIPAYLTLITLSVVGLLVPALLPRKVVLLVMIFASSALLHVGADFLLHHEDARSQWMPFTNWIYRSPVSYWDPRHYGQYFLIFEIGLGLALAILIGLRSRSKQVWAAVTFLSLGYLGSITAGLMSGADHLRGPGSCEILESNAVAKRATSPSESNVAP
ncbi:hypothetical protein [uncultured Ruegeria sp.]|uniref:hypothetical protein n=1 Tax=uncultured Ruegeria sp. TaxID=259304 RepID=UPI00262F4625|nr:hypothetical protein [uncultured Ruegeria sp.]